MKVRQFRSWETFENAQARDNVNMTFRIGYIEASPAELVRLFGKPCESDGYKVSGEYLFKVWDTYVTLYDWKMTSLYDEDYIKPEDFWKSEERYIFNVGANKKEGASDTIYSLLSLIQNKRLQKSLKEASNG